MIKKEKKVYFYRIDKSDNFDLRKILFSKEINDGYDYEGKTIEVDYVGESEGLITGLFVVTKTSGIPPKHRKRTREYTKVELDKDQGLSYGNVFLYDQANNLLLLEFNRDGAYPSKIEQFLGYAYVRSEFGNNDYEFNLLDILEEESYRKINNFDFLKQVTFRVANPDQLVEEEAGIHGSLKNMAKVARSVHANASMEVSLVGDVSQGGLDKNAVFEIIDDVLTASRINQSKRVKTKLAVSGENIVDNANRTSDTIDLMLNKLKGKFLLEDHPVQNSLQFQERKREILEIYKKKIPAVKRIFKIIS